MVGEMYCTLAEIVGSKGGRLMKPILLPQNPHVKRGYIAVRAEEVKNANQMLYLKCSAKNLDSKNYFFGKSDPFLIISRGDVSSEQFSPVYKSEYFTKTLNCSWKPFELTVQRLCNGDYNRPIRLEVYDWNRSGNHELIGFHQTTLDELVKSGSQKSYILVNPELKKKKKSYIGSGNITIESIKVEQMHTFLEYIRGGSEVSLICAIDFTASNGDPMQPTSLHYRQPNFMNDYQRAIVTVGDILSYYDTDKKFPVYSFGAKIPPRYDVSHCFPANLNWQNPEVSGVQGILDAYNYALSQCQLYGPTNFSQVINTAAGFARTYAETTYYILLILTDGEITDMNQTIDAVVNASTLPLSIIIVGVGNADFTNMNILDADETPLVSSTGVRMSRDIVQFVPFNNYKNSHPSVLAQEVLKEIPTQFLSYMKAHRIEPKIPIQVDSFYGGASMAKLNVDQPTSSLRFNNGNTDFHSNNTNASSSSTSTSQPQVYPNVPSYPQQPPQQQPNQQPQQYPQNTALYNQPNQQPPPQYNQSQPQYDLNGLPHYRI